MAWHRHKKRLSFTVDFQIAKQLHQVAEQQDKSIDDFIGELVEAGLKKHHVERQLIEVLKLLTPREREVAVLVARGYTNGQIARKLIISEETTRTHIRNILRKLNLRTKVELRTYLTRLGLDFPE